MWYRCGGSNKFDNRCVYIGGYEADVTIDWINYIYHSAIPKKYINSSLASEVTEICTDGSYTYDAIGIKIKEAGNYRFYVGGDTGSSSQVGVFINSAGLSYVGNGEIKELEADDIITFCYANGNSGNTYKCFVYILKES